MAKVRALDWEETSEERGDGSVETLGWEADDGNGDWYTVEQYFGSDSYGWRVKFIHDFVADCDDPDTAKARAQEHFEARSASLAEGN